MKNVKRILLTLLITLLFTLMAVASNSSDSDSKESSSASSSSESSAETEAASESKTNEDTAAQAEGTGKLGNYEIEIKSFRLAEDYEGEPIIIVTYGFTNQGDRAANFMFAVDDNAFQNGVGLNECLFVDDSAHYSSDNQTKDLRTGASLDIEVAYELNDEESDVEIEVTELISLNKNSITKVFKITE